MIKQIKILQHPTVSLSLCIFLIVLLVHLYLGFTRLHFLQDSARDVVIAQEAIQNHKWVVNYGPKASVGNFYLPPLYYQIQLILALLFPNQPLAMMLLILIVESATPVLLFLLLKRLVTRNSALLLATSYGFFYLVITFSTQAWNPNMIPFFSTLTLIAWYTTSISSSRKWILIGLLAPAIAFSLYFQALVLLPYVLFGISYVWIKQKNHRIFLAISVVLSLVIFSPYVYAEFGNNWRNTRAIYEFFSSEHSRYFDRVSKPTYLFSYLPSFVERVMIGDQSKWLAAGRTLFWLGSAALFWTARKKHVARWIAVYLVTVVISLRIFKGDKLDYYLLMLFPMIPLLMGGILSLFAKKYQLLLAALVLIFTFVSGMKFSSVRHTNSLADLKESVAFIQSFKEDGAVRLVFHNLNDTNLMYFGLSEYSELHHDTSATTIVDVCDPGDSWCVWHTKLECNINQQNEPIDSRLFQYLEKIHENQSYEFKGKKDFGELFTLAVGTVASPAGSFPHPLIENADRTGTDYLITTY